MPRCQKCGRVWRTLPGEEDDHACPNCGPVIGEMTERDRLRAELERKSGPQP